MAQTSHQPGKWVDEKTDSILSSEIDFYDFRDYNVANLRTKEETFVKCRGPERHALRCEEL
jgi:hypothetical protein